MHLISIHPAGPVYWRRKKSLFPISRKEPVRGKDCYSAPPFCYTSYTPQPHNLSVQILHTTLHLQKLDWKQLRSWAGQNTIVFYSLSQSILIVAVFCLILKPHSVLLSTDLLSTMKAFCHACRDFGIPHLICTNLAFLLKGTSPFQTLFSLPLTMSPNLQKSPLIWMIAFRVLLKLGVSFSLSHHFGYLWKY